MSQGKYEESELYKAMLSRGEYAVVSYSGDDTCTGSYYQGTQEQCEQYAKRAGSPENPYYVEHLASGYKKLIQPEVGVSPYAVFLHGDITRCLFQGSLAQCVEYASQDESCEVWETSWVTEHKLACLALA